MIFHCHALWFIYFPFIFKVLYVSSGDVIGISFLITKATILGSSNFELDKNLNQVSALLFEFFSLNSTEKQWIHWMEWWPMLFSMQLIFKTYSVSWLDRGVAFYSPCPSSYLSSRPKFHTGVFCSLCLVGTVISKLKIQMH